MDINQDNHSRESFDAFGRKHVAGCLLTYFILK